MTLDSLADRFRDYAKDLRLNLTALLSDAPGLTPRQSLGIALTCAYATRSAALRDELERLATTELATEEIRAAKGAAALMAQNNVFYRTMHLLDDREIARGPARLRMNFIAQHGIAKSDFELYCLAASAIGGCGACVNAHVAEVVKAGVSNDAIHSTIRLAATIQGSALAFSID